VVDHVSELANGAGSVTGAYTYDAFGSVRTHTGASTDWTYTGEQNDPNGLEYLRARYYDPAVGRFLRRDPWPGSVLWPQTLNPYACVLNNPCRFTDPWGLCNVEGTSFGGAPPVWGPVTPAGGCPNAHYSVPGSGSGIWGHVGDFAIAYWEHTPDYLVYRHVVVPAWDFATSRSGECYLAVGGTAVYAGAAALAYRAGNISTAQTMASTAWGLGIAAARECR
jgi:RHS repeat-associated protein